MGITAMFQPNARFFVRVSLAALVALALVAAPAIAEDDLPATSQFFDEYDTNVDGQVTKDEFRGSSEIFRLLDKDGDGVIKPADLGLPADYKPDPKMKKRRAGGEAAARRGMDPKRAAARDKFLQRLQAMDTNGDKRVEKGEWKGPAEAFDRLDRNKDGFIDAKDGRRGDRKPKANRKKGDRKGDMKGHDKADAERMLADAKKRFASLDKNGDGSVTADEAPYPKLLEMADADGNGSVSMGEFVGFMKKRSRAAGGQGRDGKARDGKKGRRRGGRMTSGMLRRWDRDDDGKVSAEEFPGEDAMFARLDADKDGVLTEADVKASRKRAKAGSDKPKTAPMKTGNLIEQQDTDGDGKLTRAEFKGTNEIWRLMDRNGDGFLTADELPKTSDK